MGNRIIISVVSAVVLACSAMGQKPASNAAGPPQYVTGPRGGCYEVTKSGKKKSVARSFCAQPSQNAAVQSTSNSNGQSRQDTRNTGRSSPPASNSSAAAGGQTTVKGNRTYIKGPKGGCYYVTASGRKQYVDRSMCQ